MLKLLAVEVLPEEEEERNTKKEKRFRRQGKELETFVSASRHWYTGEFSTMSVIVFVDAEMKLNLPI